MPTIKSYEDFEKQLKSCVSDRICWFGPRATDVLGLTELLGIKGIISCYNGSGFENIVPVLSNESGSVRKRCSGEDLAKRLWTDPRYLNFIKCERLSTVLPYDAPADLEVFCNTNGIKCLASPFPVRERLRDKTEVERISNSINIPIIPGVTGYIDEFEYSPLAEKLGLPLFLQFDDGCAGSGNFIVDSPEEFERIKDVRQGTKLNVKKFFSGRSCSIDICVTPTTVLCGTLEDMLIGATPLNSNPTEYVGGSWFDNGYSYRLRKKVSQIGLSLGKYMHSRDFVGFFHPDFLIDDDDNVYLTELNMRFGGSCGIYTNAEMLRGRVPLMGAHLMSFYAPMLEYSADMINEQNLAPLNYAFMVIKNNFGGPVTISHKTRCGLYQVTNTGFTLINSNATLDSLRCDDQILILGLPVSDTDTIVERGAHICQVVTSFPITDKQNQLTVTGRLLAERLRDFLIGTSGSEEVNDGHS